MRELPLATNEVYTAKLLKLQTLGYFAVNIFHKRLGIFSAFMTLPNQLLKQWFPSPTSIFLMLVESFNGLFCLLHITMLFQ